MVKTINIAEEMDFKIIYADVDSIFVQKHNATLEDYEKLCEKISFETNLPIAIDNWYKFRELTESMKFNWK